jgi:PQQ-dependent catabolism-associated CXXCW motif protein
MNVRSTLIVAVSLLAAAAPALAQNSFSEDVRKRPPARAPQDASPAQAPREQQQQPQSPAAASGATAPAATADPKFARAAEAESKDFGVAPTDTLHEGPMHAPTPTRIPGALVITTEALQMLYQRESALLVFDVLGGPQMLPNAQNALPAGQAGSFSDQTQREFGNYLQQVTGGDKDVPLVFYCQSVECWMSYNAALRAVKLGYTQLFWYRGGIEAWQAAGLQVTQRQRW